MDYIEINKKLWDAKTEHHISSDFYSVEHFLQGKSSLNDIELELLGDIKGKKILHLQCHFGQDSIELARRGAIVTGVDLSPTAIEEARKLNEKVGTEVRFIQSNVFDLSSIHNETYDIVFTSYGVLGWLHSMNEWAKVIRTFLAPTGQLILVEFHPVIWIFDYDFENIIYDYSSKEPIIEETEGTYADKEAPIKNTSYSWNHSLSDVISALRNHNITIDCFQEYTYSPYNCFNNTIEFEKGKFKIKGLEDKIPMVYSIVGKIENE